MWVYHIDGGASPEFFEDYTDSAHCEHQSPSKSIEKLALVPLKHATGGDYPGRQVKTPVIRISAGMK